MELEKKYDDLYERAFTATENSTGNAEVCNVISHFIRQRLA